MKEEIKAYNSSAEKRSAIRLLVVEFIVLILIGLVLVFVLNYFNVISLEKINGLFGVLPSKETNIDSPIQQELIESEEFTADLPFAQCPLENKQDCLKGEVVDDGEEYYGIGYKDLPVGAAIIANIRGDVEFSQEGDLYMVTLSDGPNGQQAIFEFSGNLDLVEGESSVEVGDRIGTIGEGSEYVLKVAYFSPISKEFARIKVSKSDGSYVQRKLE